MYLVIVCAGNRVIHTHAFDDKIWSRPEAAWELAVDHANFWVNQLGFDTPLSDFWKQDCVNNSFVWSNISVNIERDYTRIKDMGAVSVARAYAEAHKMSKCGAT